MVDQGRAGAPGRRRSRQVCGSDGPVEDLRGWLHASAKAFPFAHSAPSVRRCSTRSFIKDGRDAQPAPLALSLRPADVSRGATESKRKGRGNCSAEDTTRISHPAIGIRG